MTASLSFSELSLPPIGFGTGRAHGLAGIESLHSAFEAGYRLLDSAFNYENEGTVGRAVRTAGIPRDEFIVTSKLPGRRHARAEATFTIEESLFRTGLDHIDLYLIHWPNPRVDKYVEAWEALIDARERGLIRHIGVSNFLPEHIERLEAETGVRPVVNQIELHPWFPQESAVAYHRERGIITEAWSPLGRGNGVTADPVIERIAAGHDVSPAEIVLAWHVARGVVPIPRSASPERQRLNIAAAHIELSAEEIALITALGRPDGRLADQDPAVYEEF